MESLVFVVLFSVVVVAWMSQGSCVGAIVRRVPHQRALMCGEQVLVCTLWPALCSEDATVPVKGRWCVRVRGDRRFDSGRGRPLLHLN